MSCPRLWIFLSLSFCVLASGALPATASARRVVTPIALQFSPTLRPPNGEYWKDLRIPSIDKHGNVAFRAFVDAFNYDGGVNSAYRTSDNGFIARAGEQAPGLAEGMVFDRLTNLELSSGGRAALLGHVKLSDAQEAAGIWAENADGSLRLVVLEGTRPPGAPEGAALADLEDPVVDYPNPYSVKQAPFTVNGRGETAFSWRLDWPAAERTSYGIWSEGGGRGLRPVAYTGMAAPQFAPGATFVQFDTRQGIVPINDRGVTAFAAWLDSPATPHNQNQGLFVDDPQQGLLVAARSGAGAPGLEAGLRFGAFGPPTLNNAGQLAFTASYRGDDFSTDLGRGIWSGFAEDLRLVARTGDMAPGVEGTFMLLTTLPWSPLVMNGRGQVAFAARVTGAGIDESNDTGIWAQDASGQLRLIVREGQLTRPDARGPIDFLERSHIMLNNRGQVAFTADDGVWATDLAGNIQPIVRRGDLLPFHHGFTPSPADAAVATIAIGPSTGNEEGLGSSFNDRGEFVFYAYSEGNNVGVFLSRAVAVPEPGVAAMLVGTMGLMLIGRAWLTRRG